MTAEQFSSMFAMAQAAPGPNMMIVPLVGWHVAGPMGLLVTSFAKFGPSSLITVYALKFWNNFKSHPLRARFEKALKPITVGLVLVSAWIIAQASAQNILLIAIVVLTIVLSVFKNVHPVWLMLIGAGTGVLIL
jgi:chromate transporter